MNEQTIDLSERNISDLPEAEQNKILDAFADKWSAIGLSTEPMEPERAFAGVKALLEQEGVKIQGELRFETCASPKAFVDKYGRDAYSQVVWGAFEAGRLSGYSALLQFYGERETVKDLDPLMEITKACGFVWFDDKNLVVIGDRPARISLDERGDLHAEDTSAIEYRDGACMYFWRGTNVPKEWIMDRANVDPGLVLRHENASMRSILAQILGWDRVLTQLNPRTIHEDERWGTLLEVQDGPVQGRFLRVTCPTGRSTVLGVPEDCETALAAQSALCRVPEAVLARAAFRT